MRVAALLALTLSLPAPALAITGAVEFGLGVADSLSLNDAENDQGRTLMITPAIEFELGSVIFLGAEYMFVWFVDDFDDAERHLVMSPHARLRMSFPLVDALTFDGLFGIGPTIWTGLDGPLADTRFGWSLRFNFGVGYGINDAVAVFLNAGYYTTTSYGDDLDATYSTVPLGLGIRGSF